MLKNYIAEGQITEEQLKNKVDEFRTNNKQTVN